MALTILHDSVGKVDRGQESFILQEGTGAFTTTSQVGTIGVKMQRVKNVFLNVVGRGAENDLTVTADNLGTVAATTTWYLRPTRAGVISRLKIFVATTHATHADNHWTFDAVNKGQAGAGTAVVAAGDPVNSTDTTGSAITALTARSLTLGAAGDLVVAAGDIIAVTATKAASAVDLVNLNIQMQYTPTYGSDEKVYWTDTLLDDGTFAVGADGVINVARDNITSGQKFNYLILGW